MPDLYTVICEYGGGTYIAQLRAASPQQAVLRWRDTSVPESLSKEEILESLKNDVPVGVEGCQNVWCSTGVGRKGLVLINIIRTIS